MDYDLGLDQKSKILVLFNPQAGLGPSLPPLLDKALGVVATKEQPLQNLVETVEKKISSLGFKPIIKVPQNANEMILHVKNAVKESFDLIVAAGGDGTVNLIATHVAQSNTAMSIIPVGTVNLLALNLGVPFDPLLACELLKKPKVKKIDLGVANGKYFTCIAGIGYDAYIISQVHPGLKKKWGVASYLILGIQNLFSYQFKRIRLSIGNLTISPHPYMVIVTNGKFYSKGNLIAPHAQMDDGKLDIVSFNSKRLPSFVKYALGMKTGTIHKSKEITYLQGEKIAIQKHGLHYVQLDGEYVGRTPLEISILPSAVKVVVP